MSNENVILTEAQLLAQANKCEYCEEKPCKQACPADCSPADFIMAVKQNNKCDYERSAAMILSKNPLGGICGYVCPDMYCMKACVYNDFNTSINIPAMQATIIQKAKELGVMPKTEKAVPNKKTVAVIGAGPAGLGAAAVLARKGYKVTVFDKNEKPAGALNMIPDFRLDKKIVNSDFKFLESLGDITFKYKSAQDAKQLKAKYDAVIVAAGQDDPFKLGAKGEENAVKWSEFLKDVKKYKVKGKNVAVVGGGAVAVDCAVAAAKAGAGVEIIYRRRVSDMPIPKAEMDLLLANGVNISGRTTITEVYKKGGIKTVKLTPAKGEPLNSRNLVPVKGSEQERADVDLVVIAIGSKSSYSAKAEKGIFLAGDMVNGATNAVEAVASGKFAAAQVHAFITKKPAPKAEKTPQGKVKSSETAEGVFKLPVSLESDFFGRKIKSPFLISAAPHADGYNQVKLAYEAGWAGVVMKTAFDGVDIHIPGKYMFELTNLTYANCDNVSGHPLNRVCKEIAKLIKEYPDRLTMASTGGPVTGNDASDKKGWQSNTKKLEKAGAMGIEYSLSCPQGGDGTKGDIVSQDPELTAKIIDWVMEVSNPDVPKLFKLTGAVTSLYPILDAINNVFKKYPGKKAGVTLANTFPSLAFREGKKKNWDEGVVVGMSGEGVTFISNLSLANAARHKMHISGNGGPMHYKAAADFLALGVQTVQFCTIVMKYGYGVIDELESGLSFYMKQRGIKSVKELIGKALPNPITGFMELTPVKEISDCNKDLCLHCGNCSRCPYLAISTGKDGFPSTDASKCIGCSICVQKCFSGALFMRERTKKELAVLKED